MRIFFTRHGQVYSKKYYNGDASRPVGDSALSDLGREQALLIGKRLKELHFNGIVLSSPYDRTLETAQIICEQVDAKFSPLGCLREIFQAYQPPAAFNGLTAERIVENYSRAEISYPLSYPWWENKTEDLADVIERVKMGLKEVLPNISKEQDVLLVGHAATAVAVRHLFGVTDNLTGFHWNCHLSLLYDSNGENYACDCRHLTGEKQTGNALVYLQEMDKVLKNEAGISALKEKNSSDLILHIGDTASADYRYYQRLIEFIHPAVIIHTGDLVDELKAGRIESVRPYWKTAMPKIIDIMRRSGARIIVVPGNNDLLEDLQAVEGIEVVAPRTVLDLYGVKVQVCHRVLDIDEKAQTSVYLYGHGTTGETRTAENNLRGEKRYFNASWGPSVHSLKDGESLILSHAHI